MLKGMVRRPFCALAGVLALVLSAHAAPRHPPRLPPPAPFGPEPALLQFADELAQQEGWDAAALREQLSQAQRLPRVRQLILPAAPGAAKDWAAYSARFIEPKRIAAGVAFWQENEAALARAEVQYGVPADVIVGILGVETFYGRLTGGFKALDALATLGFDFPAEHPRALARQSFFRAELADLLRLARESGLDASAVQGSYAGALGWPQFMPGSWRRHAVDFDGDGRRDLINSPVDAIGSIANFLVAHGWQRGVLTDYSISLPRDRATRERLLKPDIEPTWRAAELVALGAKPSEAALDHAGLLAVVALQNGRHKPPTVRLGTENFQALTRYNQSAYYAFAVIDLGRAVRRAWVTTPARPASSPAVDPAASAAPAPAVAASAP